jgi:hypothetical protein
LLKYIAVKVEKVGGVRDSLIEHVNIVPRQKCPCRGHTKNDSPCQNTVVFKARLIVGQRKNHVFSQPPTGYSRISIALLALSCGYTRIKGRPLIEPLINADYRVIRAIRALSVYRKVLPT